MKRVTLILFSLLLLFAFNIDSAKAAETIDFSGGLLDGISPIGNHEGVYSITDNNVDTSYTFAGTVVPVNNLRIVFDFDDPQKIEGVRILGNNPLSDNFQIVFHNTAGHVIYNGSLLADGSYHVVATENVKRVSIQFGYPDYTYTISEFNVYGEGYDPSAPPPPTAPAGLTAIAGDQHVSLSWNAVNNAASYIVYRDGVEIDTTTATTYTDSDVINDTTYSYTVVAVNANGQSPQSAAVQATPTAAPTAPSAITGLSATAGNGQVALQWSAAAGAEHYIIYRDGVEIDTTTATTYTDSDVINDTTYSYTVSAVNAIGQSPQSAAVQATPTEIDTTPPTAPNGLQATPGVGRVHLSWTKNTETDLAGYNVYVDGNKINEATINSNQYTVTDLVYGQSYDFFITALDMSNNESPPSATVTSSPSAPSKAIGFNDKLPFSVHDTIKTAVSFLTMYGPWILLALGVIFAPVLYGLAMKLVNIAMTGSSEKFGRKEWIERERRRRSYWRSEEGRAALDKAYRDAGYSKAEQERMTRQDREDIRRDREERLQSRTSSRTDRPGRLGRA